MKKYTNSIQAVFGFLLTMVVSCSEDGETKKPVVNSITVNSPTSIVTLYESPTIQLSAKAFDQENKEISGVTFSWSSSETSRATVESTGKVTLLSEGSVTLTATYESISGSITIEIRRPTASAISSLMLDDIFNNGNASDLQVFFKKASNESLVSEYRVVIVKSSKSIQLVEANSLPANHYSIILKTSGDIKTTLPSAMLDSDGDVVSQGLSYKAYVLSVADGVKALENTLSSSSNVVESAQTTIKITFVGDDGVIVTDGIKTVIIDAMPPSFQVLINQELISWIPAASGLISSIQNGLPPYDDISVIMVTHDHLDHWDIASTDSFLNNHPLAKLIGPPQVVSNFSGHSQVSALNPALFESTETTIDGIKIKALRMVHFNNFGLDFSGVENYAFLVEMGGKKILHLGDADYTDQNFTPFNLDSENIDVAILPAATVKITAQNIDLVRTTISPQNIIAAHLETNITESFVKNIWGQDVFVFTQSLQYVRY